MTTIFRRFADGAVGFFVRHGFAIYRGVYNADFIDDMRFTLMRMYRERIRGVTHPDVNGIAVGIMNEFERLDAYQELVADTDVITIMQRYLGPDVCLLGYPALWINVPKDTDPVLLKNIHTDAWTGTGVNTIFCKVFLTDCDKHNGVSICPGSHLQGLLPVRNRALDTDAKFKSVNLSNIKAGDVLLWHALTLHHTTGHSDKNIRVSITSRYKSTETPFTSQERALGYRTLSVGPLNSILRLVGNDHLLPLRTHGGDVSIDRRMAKVYNSDIVGRAK